MEILLNKVCVNFLPFLFSILLILSGTPPILKCKNLSFIAFWPRTFVLGLQYFNMLSSVKHLEHCPRFGTYLRFNSKIINGRARECHNKKAQPIPSTKRKRNLHETETIKLHVNNSRKTSSLFPNRGRWSTTAYNR